MLENLNSSDQQSLFYSVLVLIFLIGGIAMRRELNLSKALKYMALWGVVVFIAVGLYSYRYEFSDFKNRIFGALNPSYARLNDQGKIVIDISQNGHFYVDLKINGVVIKFMIDTGASDIVLNIKEVEKLGLNNENLVFNKRYETANGTVFGANIVLKEIILANVKFKDVSASVNSSDMGISLLGMSFLRQFKKYEFYQDRLLLTI